MEHREVSGQFSGPRKPLPKPSLRYDSLLLKKIFRESLVHILLHSTPISTNPERMFHILTWVPFLPSSPRGQEPPSWIRSSHAAHPPYPHFPSPFTEPRNLENSEETSYIWVGPAMPIVLKPRLGWQERCHFRYLGHCVQAALATEVVFLSLPSHEGENTLLAVSSVFSGWTKGRTWMTPPTQTWDLEEVTSLGYLWLIMNFSRKRAVELFLGIDRESDAHYPLSPAPCKLSVGEMAPMWGEEP